MLTFSIGEKWVNQEASKKIYIDTFFSQTFIFLWFINISFGFNFFDNFVPLVDQTLKIEKKKNMNRKE